MKVCYKSSQYWEKALEHIIRYIVNDMLCGVVAGQPPQPFPRNYQILPSDVSSAAWAAIPWDGESAPAALKTRSTHPVPIVTRQGRGEVEGAPLLRLSSTVTVRGKKKTRTRPSQIKTNPDEQSADRQKDRNTRSFTQNKNQKSLNFQSISPSGIHTYTLD